MNDLFSIFNALGSIQTVGSNTATKSHYQQNTSNSANQHDSTAQINTAPKMTIEEEANAFKLAEAAKLAQEKEAFEALISSIDKQQENPVNGDNGLNKAIAALITEEAKIHGLNKSYIPSDKKHNALEKAKRSVHKNKSKLVESKLATLDKKILQLSSNRKETILDSDKYKEKVSNYHAKEAASKKSDDQFNTGAVLLISLALIIAGAATFPVGAPAIIAGIAYPAADFLYKKAYDFFDNSTESNLQEIENTYIIDELRKEHKEATSSNNVSHSTMLTALNDIPAAIPDASTPAATVVASSTPAATAVVSSTPTIEAPSEEEEEIMQNYNRPSF